MPKLFRATVIVAADHSREIVEGEFTDAEWRRLASFPQFESELSETEYVRAGMPLDTEVSWSAAGGWDQPILPDPPIVRDFLMMLRPFLLKNEPTNFYDILNIISRRYESAPLRTNLRLLKDSYSGKLDRSRSVMSLSDLVINADDGINSWLNAFEYHRDVDKRALFGEAAQNVPLEVLKVFFIDLLRAKVIAIQWLAMFLRCSAASPEQDHTITL
ncbi:MAG: hypothetical protein IBJ19_09595 [Gemmatimonadaceae bacterium]|nr:hypothetical protein [Gemmatimonadaceae bacterium]